MASSSPVAADPSPAVSLRGVVKHYGAVRAVDGIDLEIHRGEVFGLIGHNGAGKSTLFKTMLGLIPATGGEIHILGRPIRGRAFREVRREIGYLPENVVLWDNLSGLETLRFLARLKRAPLHDCEAALERVGLAQAAGRPVREYSKGMRQRLGFAQALLGRPQVLFLDEPTSGLDPEAIRAFYATLRTLRSEGVTMIMTSHILSELQERVDRLAILAAGKVRAQGSVQALRERTALPLRAEVRASAGDMPAVRDALAALPTVTVLPQGDERLEARFPREAKMRLLAALAGLGARVADVQLHEPTLEDLFFGVAE
ncbi:MAG: ABC transporter ATP-binding protein [Burkholderiales bacterium]|nr:ABC transporter ATP-binding protein [Burkholderiales bacterium]